MRTNAQPLLLVNTSKQIQDNILRISSKIQEHLKGAKPLIIKIQHPIIEDEHYPVFSKTLVIVKNTVPKTSACNDEYPDLTEVFDSPLPWMGESTFNTASRQFRNKNRLAINQDVVLRFGDELYAVKELLVAQKLGFEDYPLYVYATRKSNQQLPVDDYLYISRLQLSDEEVSAHTHHDLPLSPALIMFMHNNGYKYKNRVEKYYIFEATNEDGKIFQLVVLRHGAVIDMQ